MRQHRLVTAHEGRMLEHSTAGMCSLRCSPCPEARTFLHWVSAALAWDACMRLTEAMMPMLCMHLTSNVEELQRRC